MMAETLPAIKDMLSAALPPLLKKHGVGDFEEYVVGYPVEKQKLSLSVRLASGNRGSEKNLVFNIHAQLPGISEMALYGYIDALNEYLDGFFEPADSGYMDFNYSFAATDNFRAATLEVFWDVTLVDAVDDCDPFARLKQGE